MPERDDYRTLLRKGLANSGFTVDELARRSGVNRATIYRALASDSDHAPSTRTIDRLLKAFGEDLRPSHGGADTVPRAEHSPRKDLKGVQHFRPSPAEEVQSLIMTVFLLLRNEVATRSKLTPKERDRLFDNPPLDSDIVVKLARAMGIFSKRQGEIADVLFSIATLVARAGTMFPLRGEPFDSLIRELALEGAHGISDDAVEPYAAVTRHATALIHDLSSKPPTNEGD